MGTEGEARKQFRRSPSVEEENPSDTFLFLVLCHRSASNRWTLHHAFASDPSRRYHAVAAELSRPCAVRSHKLSDAGRFRQKGNTWRTILRCSG